MPLEFERPFTPGVDRKGRVLHKSPGAHLGRGRPSQHVMAFLSTRRDTQTRYSPGTGAVKSLGFSCIVGKTGDSCLYCAG